MEAKLDAMSVGGLLGLWFQSLFVGLTMKALSICIMLVVYGRMIEIYLVTSIAPIPVATMVNREWGGMGQNYIRSVLALGFLGGYIHFFKAYAWGEAFLLSGCVGVSLVVAMVISSLVGTVIPMLFHKIHIDPAVASGPLITTINDLVAVVVYYGLAAVVLIDMFHLG